MLESIERQNAAMRAALAPFENLRRSAIFGIDSPFRQNMEQARQVLAAFDRAQFRLPEMAETARLIADLRSGPLAESVARYAAHTFGLREPIESMRTPWLDTQQSLRSVSAFAELQGIGHAVRNMPAFGENLSAALRTGLGDWRDAITWPPDIFRDCSVRSDFYENLGFDRALTDFPPPAFEQSLDIAGFHSEMPVLVARYGRPVQQLENRVEEEALARTNAAYDWLLRLETQLRRFIDECLTEAFGEDWPKHRLPNGLYEQWQEKKKKAKQADGKEWPLISYADFTDYERVICRTDNWHEVFAALFGRPESVRESFQRLYPIRLDTMHARPITQDDELLLYVETRRLVKVITIQRD